MAFGYNELRRPTSGGTVAALHVVNDADRLLEDEQFFYSYDANGNLVSKIAKADGATTNYMWDAQNQLIRIDRANGSSVDYAYDALGRRIEKDVDGAVTRYVYDGEDIYLETDGTGTLQVRYAHGDRTDQPLSLERAGADFFYHADHQGSIRQVTDAAGVVVNTYEYDSYGNFLARVETVAQPYGYTAREQDEESDLYYYRARYYDTGTGRFISEDPIGFDSNDFNLYRYVSNNPVNLVDPSGLIFGLPGGVRRGADFIGNAIRNAAGAAGRAACDVLSDPVVQAGLEGAASGGVTGAIAGGGPGAVLGAAAGALLGAGSAQFGINSSGGEAALASAGASVLFSTSGGRLSAAAGGGVGGGLGGPEGAAAGGFIGGAIDGALDRRNRSANSDRLTRRNRLNRGLSTAARGAGAGLAGAGAGILTGGALDGIEELCDDCTNE